MQGASEEIQGATEWMRVATNRMQELIERRRKAHEVM
jgi:hypothetical protein